MERDPKRSLETLRRHMKAYASARGPRMEERRAVELAIHRAELEVGNLSRHLGDPDHFQLYRELTFEAELAKGTLVHEASGWR
jgi:hypothetical protein